MEWISVKDRLPEEATVVWAIEENHQGPIMADYSFMSDGENSGFVWSIVYDIPTYHKGVWIYTSYFDDQYNVTHWMPLPEPPKQ